MWRAATLAVAIAAVVSSAGYIVWKVGGIGNGPCGQAIGAAQQWGIVAACVVAFGAGHALARHRHEERDPQTGDVVRDDRVAPGAFHRSAAPPRI